MALRFPPVGRSWSAFARLGADGASTSTPRCRASRASSRRSRSSRCSSCARRVRSRSPRPRPSPRSGFPEPTTKGSCSGPPAPPDLHEPRRRARPHRRGAARRRLAAAHARRARRGDRRRHRADRDGARLCWASATEKAGAASSSRRWREGTRSAPPGRRPRRVPGCSSVPWSAGSRRLRSRRSRSSRTSGPCPGPRSPRIRGVAADSAVASLVERGLIAEAGRESGPGGAVRYRVTALFERVFGLESLAALPRLDDIGEDQAAIRDRLLQVAEAARLVRLSQSGRPAARVAAGRPTARARLSSTRTRGVRHRDDGRGTSRWFRPPPASSSFPESRSQGATAGVAPPRCRRRARAHGAARPAGDGLRGAGGAPAAVTGLYATVVPLARLRALRAVAHSRPRPRLGARAARRSRRDPGRRRRPGRARRRRRASRAHRGRHPAHRRGRPARLPHRPLLEAGAGSGTSPGSH